jgi:hypothetical protein
MCREAVTQEHGQKINRYQAILAARLKAKFFSKKAFDRGTHALFNLFYFLESPIMLFFSLSRQRDHFFRAVAALPLSEKSFILISNISES